MRNLRTNLLTLLVFQAHSLWGIQVFFQLKSTTQRHPLTVTRAMTVKALKEKLTGYNIEPESLFLRRTNTFLGKFDKVTLGDINVLENDTFMAKPKTVKSELEVLNELVWQGDLAKVRERLTSVPRQDRYEYLKKAWQVQGDQKSVAYMAARLGHKKVLELFQEILTSEDFTKLLMLEAKGSKTTLMATARLGDGGTDIFALIAKNATKDFPKNKDEDGCTAFTFTILAGVNTPLQQLAAYYQKLDDEIKALQDLALCRWTQNEHGYQGIVRGLFAKDPEAESDP